MWPEFLNSIASMLWSSLVDILAQITESRDEQEILMLPRRTVIHIQPAADAYADRKGDCEQEQNIWQQTWKQEQPLARYATCESVSMCSALYGSTERAPERVEYCQNTSCMTYFSRYSQGQDLLWVI